MSKLILRDPITLIVVTYLLDKGFLIGSARTDIFWIPKLLYDLSVRHDQTLLRLLMLQGEFHIVLLIGVYKNRILQRILAYWYMG